MSLYDLYRQLTLSRKILLLFLSAVLLRIYLTYLEYDSSQENFMSSVNDNNCSLDIYRDLQSRHSITEQSLNASKVESAVYQRKKIFFAFYYWEQLTMATNNFLHLTALAVQEGRQVVVPFVKDSWFRGAPTLHRHHLNTLGLYYNVTALNESLRLHGHGTLINWEGFQDACKGKLDVLIYFYYSKLTSSKHAPCNHLNDENVFLGIKIGRRICVNANAFKSVQRFEEEILKRLPCVGIFEWRGIKKGRQRTQFDIESKVPKLLSFRDMISAFFSAKLLRVARDFIAQHLTSNFISVHIRTEQILRCGGNISTVNSCLFKLRKRLQSIIQVATVSSPPIFLATDFTAFGSSSKDVTPARKHAKSFMKVLLPLRPVIFQPSEYKIVDRGAVAIVEMNILASGRRLFVLGGGTFQTWMTTQFLTKNNYEQSKVERFIC